MNIIRQILFGKKADPEELQSLNQYLASELRLAAAQTRASEAFNSAAADLGMKVLSGEADETMRRQMGEAAASYSTGLLSIQQEHAAIQAPEAAAAYYAAQQVVYGEHLIWSRAQQVLYQHQVLYQSQSLGAEFAAATLRHADARLAADKRQAEKLRASLVKYMGISRHALNQMMRDAGAFQA